MMTVGSCFSGIGGIDLGLQRAGMEIRWQVEIDDWCRRVLAKHWPDVTRYGDIRELTGGELEPVDVIAGGFPCQPASHAGRRKGRDDDRWLWPELMRLVRVVRPRCVLLENVPGLLVRGFGEVVGDLAASGYDAEWDCIPSAAFGSPHLRDRVYIIAYASGVRRDAGRSEQSLQRSWLASEVSMVESPWWDVEPGICRVAYGIPDGVDRIRALGNAVVPQVVELIGRRIITAAPAPSHGAVDEEAG